MGPSIGMAIVVACKTCLQAYEVWEYEDVEANKFEFQKKPSLQMCPTCFHSVDADVISTPQYIKRWKKAASKILR